MESVTITLTSGETITLTPEILEKHLKVPDDLFRTGVMEALKNLDKSNHTKNVAFIKRHHLSLAELKASKNLWYYIVVSLEDIDLANHMFDRYELQIKNTPELRKYVCVMVRWAAKNGYVAVLELLFNRVPLTIEDVRADDNRALQLAAENGHVAVLELLFNRAPLSIEDVRANDNASLGLAAKNGHVAVLELLFNRFPLTIKDVRAANNYAIRWAAKEDHVAVLEFLFERFPELYKSLSFST